MVALFERSTSSDTYFEGLEPIQSGTLPADLRRPGGSQYRQERKSVFPMRFAEAVNPEVTAGEAR